MKFEVLSREKRFSLIKYGIYIIFLLVFFEFIFKPGHVSSGSMMPTILVDDIIVTNRLEYLFVEPEVNDIISFSFNDETFCKRIIGVEGDEISFLDGKVYRNGEMAEEPFIPEDIETICEKTFVVPEGKVFVLGDWRINSNDSRYWDNPYVDVDDIYGEVVIIIPIQKMKMYLGIHSNY